MNSHIYAIHITRSQKLNKTFRLYILQYLETIVLSEAMAIFYLFSGKM